MGAFIQETLERPRGPGAAGGSGAQQGPQKGLAPVVVISWRETKSPSQNLCEFKLRRTRRDAVTAETRRLWGAWAWSPGEAGGQEWVGRAVCRDSVLEG